MGSPRQPNVMLYQAICFHIMCMHAHSSARTCTLTVYSQCLTNEQIAVEYLWAESGARELKLSIHQRGVRSEGGAVDGGSII